MKQIKTSAKSKAFAKSFVSGMAAPLMLFGKFQAPEIVTVPYVKPKQISVKDALAKDWRLVGSSIQVAVSKYGQKS